MAAGDRFAQWIDQTAQGWADRLATWSMGVMTRAVIKAMEEQEPGLIENYREAMAVVRDNPNTPPEMKKAIEGAMGTGNLPSVIMGALFSSVGFLSALLGTGAPIGRLMEYEVDKIWKSYRFNPQVIMNLWRRNPEKYEIYLDELRDQGMTNNQIEALMVVTQFIPQVSDIVRFALREVYDPKTVAKYGMVQDVPGGAYADAEKAGLTNETFLKYWAAHWELPSSGQGYEMLHRGIITEDELMDLLRVNDIMPFWRPKLAAISWNVPTRVDVRRFWEMRTIDEARLREIYTAMGYHAQDLEDYVLWTKIYTEYPNLLARYKNGWITLDEVKDELVAMGMSAERAQQMLEEKIKKEAPERTVSEKNLTKTEIYKGVKQGKITRTQAQVLLMELGYDADEAEYLLAINIPEDQVDEVIEERQLTKADILKGLKTEVLTRDQARDQLLELRYSAASAELLLKIYDAQVEPPTGEKLKEASKTDIITGVKKGVITQEEGYSMLLELGYDPEAAMFILDVQTTESPFSPTNYDEFKDLVGKYRNATGAARSPAADKVNELAEDVINLDTEVGVLREKLQRAEAELAKVEVLPPAATAERDQIREQLRQAEAELVRTKSDYQAAIAAWRRTVAES